MRRLLLAVSMLFAGLLHAEDAAIVVAPPREVSGNTLWRASLTSLAVANAMDVHSSWGKHELNPILSNSRATFGGQGALLKLAFQGGLMGAEYLLTRGRPSGKLYRALAFINFGASAGIASVAVHNYTVSRPSR